MRRTIDLGLPQPGRYKYTKPRRRDTTVPDDTPPRMQKRPSPDLVRKCCLGYTLSCGCTLALVVLLFTVLSVMRVEHTVRQAWTRWVHDDLGL